MLLASTVTGTAPAVFGQSAIERLLNRHSVAQALHENGVLVHYKQSCKGIEPAYSVDSGKDHAVVMCLNNIHDVSVATEALNREADYAAQFCRLGERIYRPPFWNKNNVRYTITYGDSVDGLGDQAEGYPSEGPYASHYVESIRDACGKAAHKSVLTDGLKKEIDKV